MIGYILPFLQKLTGSSDQGSVRLYTFKEGAKTLTLRFTALGLGFVSNILLARLLGVEGYGIYAYALSCINLLAVPAVLGLDRLLVRETAILAERQDWGMLRGLLQWGNSLALGVTTMLVAVTALIGWWFLTAENAPTVHAVWVALTLLPFMALTKLRGATLAGLRQVALATIPEELVRPVIYITLLAVAYFFLHTQLTAADAIRLNLTAFVSGFGVGAWLLWQYLPQEVKSSFPAFHSKEWLGAAFTLSLLSALHTINLELRFQMLGILGDARDMGIFAVAVRGADLISIPQLAINAVLAPLLARFYSENNMSRLQTVVTKGAQLTLAITLPIVMVCLIFGEWVMSIFGPEFSQGASVLSILCIGGLANAIAGSVGLLLTMTRNEKYAVRSVAITLLLNVSLNGLLIPRYGAQGAAIAQATCFIVINMLFMWWANRLIGIRPTAFAGRFW